MIRQRLFIALAAWVLSSVAVVLSVLVLVGVLGSFLGSWGTDTLFGLVVGAFFCAAWGTQFEMARAWIHDRKVHPSIALAGPVVAVLVIGIFWNALLFCFPVVVLGAYLAWFHWPWAVKKEEK